MGQNINLDNVGMNYFLDAKVGKIIEYLDESEEDVKVRFDAMDDVKVVKKETLQVYKLEDLGLIYTLHEETQWKLMMTISETTKSAMRALQEKTQNMISIIFHC